MIYSGLPKVNKTRSAHGVAICLDKTATNIWKLSGSEWEAVNERIIKIRMYCAPINVTYIAVYASVNPHNKSMIDKCDRFYIQLQETIDKVPKGDMIILMDDCNARVGKQEHLTVPQVGGKQNVENSAIQDKNDKLLINFRNKLDRWKEYFCELLNVNSVVDPYLIHQISIPSTSTEERDRQSKPPTLEEIEETLKQMRNRKASGNDDISADILKAGGLPVLKWLHEIFVDIW
ncbi:unnamed protein product [Rotaria sp. Silwood1]|nr:unnamed protein product [Rotaria sp. Silwood1]